MLGPDIIPPVSGFELLALPEDVVSVFKAINAVWEAFPFTLRMVLVFLFAMITLFAVLKMLT